MKKKASIIKENMRYFELNPGDTLLNCGITKKTTYLLISRTSYITSQGENLKITWLKLDEAGHTDVITLKGYMFYHTMDQGVRVITSVQRNP